MSTATREKVCANCAAYDEQDPKCRRNPPTIHGHPITKPDNWCLQHQISGPKYPGLEWREEWGVLDNLLGIIHDGNDGVTLGDIAEQMGLDGEGILAMGRTLHELRNFGVLHQQMWTFRIAPTSAELEKIKIEKLNAKEGKK